MAMQQDRGAASQTTGYQPHAKADVLTPPTPTNNGRRKEIRASQHANYKRIRWIQIAADTEGSMQ